jgi:hypothetical protein
MAKKPLLPAIESRTVSVSIKVPERVAKAIEKAAADHKRTRSALVWGVLEVWLTENGYLKTKESK